MSILIGVRRENDTLVDEAEMRRLAAPTERYAPDGTFLYAGFGLGIGYQPFHTAQRSALDSQPWQDRMGNVVTFDGRLDNRDDLRQRLGISDPEIADSRLVLASFLRWGDGSFSKFIGEWALALWNVAERCVYLARDHAGTRTLYLWSKGNSHVWSTYLETLLGIGESFAPDEEYVARFLSSLPFQNLTPYKGIRAIPAAHWLKINRSGIIGRAHWMPTGRAQIRYKFDTDYQEHFFSLFQQSVERRAPAGEPILAQLSGGMDSTSIVCMSDHVRRTQRTDADLIDTLSLYDDFEPHWNERPFFSITESRRGKAGIHVEVPFLPKTFCAPDRESAPLIFPGSDATRLDFEATIQNAIKDRGYRVLLSGIGGDELLGGVPTPLPELSEYLGSFRLKTLLQQTAAWSIANRLQFWGLLWDTVRFTWGVRDPELAEKQMTPPWMSHRLRVAFAQKREPDNPSIGSPGRDVAARSIQVSWEAALETAPHLNPESTFRYEYRYPYFDRDLVDFLCSIPRNQLVRPGRRRYLMREALKMIVPPEILERRRKAYIVRRQAMDFESARHCIGALLTGSLAEHYGFVDGSQCLTAVSHMNGASQASLWHQLLRTAMLETWLRAANSCRVLTDFGPDLQRSA